MNAIRALLDHSWEVTKDNKIRDSVLRGVDRFFAPSHLYKQLETIGDLITNVMLEELAAMKCSDSPSHISVSRIFFHPFSFFGVHVGALVVRVLYPQLQRRARHGREIPRFALPRHPPAHAAR